MGSTSKNDTEIDLVAVSQDQRLRFGSCKRSPARLRSDVNNFKGHVERFMQTFPKYQSWRIEYVGIAPELDDETRSFLTRHDVQSQDLNDLTRDLV